MQCGHGVTLEFMKMSFSGTVCYLVICVFVCGVHYHWSSCECMDCIVYAYGLFHAVITECLRKIDTAWKTNIY